MTEQISLPELPNGSSAFEYVGDATVFNTDELRAYAREHEANVRAELARSAAPAMDAEHWAELYRLREAVKGPPGFATWQDAATAERIRRVRAESAVGSVPDDYQRIGLLEWAVESWRSSVQNRPLVNIHRRTMDDCWRSVMRYAGGDPDALVGPSHDEMLAAAPTALPAVTPQVADEGPKDGLVAPFPIITLGYGLVEIGDATWEGLHALFFGCNGADVGPLGSKRVRDNKAEDGETLALVTFANLKSLEQVEDALSRVRRNMEAGEGQ